MGSGFRVSERLKVLGFGVKLLGRSCDLASMLVIPNGHKITPSMAAACPPPPPPPPSWGKNWWERSGDAGDGDWPGDEDPDPSDMSVVDVRRCKKCGHNFSYVRSGGCRSLLVNLLAKSL